MTEKQVTSQISHLSGILVQHERFWDLSNDDAQWVIKNPKDAIALFSETIKNRNSKKAETPEIEKPKILDFVGCAIVSCMVDKFVARECFAEGGPVKFYGFGDNFKNWFGKKIEKGIGDTNTLRYHKLLENSVDGPIITELGGEEKAETTLTELYLLLLGQKNGEKGPLLTNGYWNLFYIRDAKGLLRAVSVGWCDGGWDVSANSVSVPDGWDAGFQVFSRDS